MSTKEQLFCNAATNNDLSTISNYIEQGIDVNCRINRIGASIGNSALELAAKAGYIDVVNKLLDAGAKDVQDALCAAAFSGHVEVVERLLSAGAKADGFGTHETYAITNAAWAGHVHIIEILINAGAINIQDALCAAASYGYIEAVNVLLNAGAKIDVGDKDHRDSSALFAAASGAHISVINLLLGRGSQDIHNALYGAVLGSHSEQEGGYEAIQILLKAGANSNARDPRPHTFGHDWNNTVLIEAAYRCDLRTISLLLDAGANKNLKNSHGETALDVIRKTRSSTWVDRTDVDNVISVLENFGSFKSRLRTIAFDESRLPEGEHELYTMLCCPISREIMEDPIAISSGITYDRESLNDYLESQKNPSTGEVPDAIKCPISKQWINKNELYNKTHIITKNFIDGFVSKLEAEFKSRELIGTSTAVQIGMFASRRGNVDTNVDSLMETKGINPSTGSSSDK